MAANRHDHHGHGPNDFERPDLSKPENRHEHRDVNVWAVYKFAIGLAILCVVSVGLLFGLYHFFLSQQGGPAPGGGQVDARSLPPLPRLQSTPVEDLRNMREAEEKILYGFGWIDRPHGVVRIPIQRAIDLLAQRGLPTRPQTGPQSAASNVIVPTESGFGPKMQQPGGPLAGELTK